MAQTTVQQEEQRIMRRSGIPLAQPEATTPPPQQRAAAAPEAPRPGLAAEGSSLVPGARQVPEVGDGQTPVGNGALFGPGGNMLQGWFLDVPDGEDFSMRCVFTVPGLPGGVVLDLGDGSEPVEFNSAGGSVEHEYPALSAGASSVVYDAVCRDEHNRLRGWIRFRLPHTRTAGQDMRSGHPASLIV
jgi:hypothetical protein